jgi:hypothetical protein
MHWFLPKIPPTHSKIAVDVVVVVQFVVINSPVRIYWDHASVLRQVGLLK